MWKKKKRRYSRLVILDPKNDTTKKIKKILSEKHPGYEKRSKDEKMFNQACNRSNPKQNSKRRVFTRLFLCLS